MTHQGDGHNKVKVKISTSFPILCQILLISTHDFFVWLQVINKVKVIHQGEGHIKVKVKYPHPFKFYVAHTICKPVICIRVNAFLFFLVSLLSATVVAERLCFHKLVSRILSTGDVCLWVRGCTIIIKFTSCPLV